jgi:magnesium transporter
MGRFITRGPKKAGLPPGSLIPMVVKTQDKTNITLFHYDESRCAEREAVTAEECFPLKETTTVCWINVDSVHNAEVMKRLGEAFNLHPLVLEDILNTEQRPKLEDYGDYCYIVLKMLTYSSESIISEQVSLILGKNYVISFQEAGKPGDVFDPIRKRLRNGGGRIRKQGADFLAYSLMDAIVDQYFVILEAISERIEILEEELVNNPVPETVNAIHRLRREMIYLRRSVWPLREVVNSLYRGELALMTPATHIYLRDLYDHTVRVIDTIETLRDLLSGILDIYLSSVSYRMNEIMKVLTIIATVFIPLTFIVGVYGMNFDFFPELHWHWAYPILWIIMTGVALAMLVFFRRKKWI